MINVGLTIAGFNFNLDKVTVFHYGIKNCPTWAESNNAVPRFTMTNNGVMARADYTRDSNKDSIDMFGFIYTPSNIGQYGVTTRAF